MSYNTYKSKHYPGQISRTLKGGGKDNFLDNFKRDRSDYSGVGEWGNDGLAVSNRVKRYPPNDLVLFGMYGNMA
ncbi:MAG: hypothetical protein ABI045_06090 [Flavobacteriales bacterium]